MRSCTKFGSRAASKLHAASFAGCLTAIGGLTVPFAAAKVSGEFLCKSSAAKRAREAMMALLIRYGTRRVWVWCLGVVERMSLFRKWSRLTAGRLSF